MAIRPLARGEGDASCVCMRRGWHLRQPLSIRILWERAGRKDAIRSNGLELGATATGGLRPNLLLACAHSAASRTSGAAARTSASTWLSKGTKFFWNMATSLRAVSSNSALSCQVLSG